MKWLVLVVVVFISISCGAFKSPLEKEYTKLNAEKSATESSAAEDLYNKAEKFVVRVQKTKDAPDGLLAKARDLQKQRARDFTKAAAKNWDFGSARKVYAALLGADLNPETEVVKAGVDPAKLEKAPVKKIDPTNDNLDAWK